MINNEQWKQCRYFYLERHGWSATDSPPCIACNKKIEGFFCNKRRVETQGGGREAGGREAGGREGGGESKLNLKIIWNKGQTVKSYMKALIIIKTTFLET